MKSENNKINYLHKMKIELKTKKNFYTSYYNSSYYYCHEINYIIILKRYKKFIKCNFIPVVLNKNKMKQCINNLAIDHLQLYLNCPTYLNPLMQLTLCITITKFVCPAYALFCKFLKNIIQIYCKDMHVIIEYPFSNPSFMTKLGDGVNIIKKDYATINKFKVNYHRNYQLKNRKA